MCNERFERIEEDRKSCRVFMSAGDVLQIAGTTVEATCLALDARVRIYSDSTGDTHGGAGAGAGRQTLDRPSTDAPHPPFHADSGPGDNGSRIGK